jgi:hypothetical protein
MKKLLTLMVATAWLAVPAIAGTIGTKGTAITPSAEQQTKPAPQEAPRPGSPADQRDDIIKGLGRNPEDCNKGCIGNPP